MVHLSPYKHYKSHRGELISDRLVFSNSVADQIWIRIMENIPDPYPAK